MNAYQPRTDDMQFVLSRVLNAPSRLQALPAFAEVDPDLMQQVLDESGKFVGSVIAPLNRDGDEIGCRFEQGHVITPPGFREAYQAFWQAGWPALACDPEFGGQGLPIVVNNALYEMLNSAGSVSAEWYLETAWHYLWKQGLLEGISSFVADRDE